MEREKTGRRLERRRKKMERRRLEREKIEQLTQKKGRADLFMRIGIICVLALIVVDFYVTMNPLFSAQQMSFELMAISYLIMQGLGIGFGLGLYFAGRRMERDTGVYGGVFQVDGSIIATISLVIYLIVQPLRYTQEELIVNSLYYGLETISSITLLIFTLMIAFFFILVGSNSQVHPLRYVLIVVGILWLVELFLPALTPSPFADPTTYASISALTWVVYGLTGYILWKILYQSEELKPQVTGAPYKIK